MQLETVITARFVEEDATPEQQANLDAMNVHADDCAKRLQGPFSSLIIEMMDLKRATFAKAPPVTEALEEADRGGS
jgi:hypothetical protein